MAKRKKQSERPIYLRVVRLVVPETGELVGAFIPDSPADRVLVRDRNLRAGQQVRSTISAPRNVKFHRLAHALGTIVVGQVEGFSNLDAHAAIKRLQVEAGICCDESQVEVPGVGSMAIRQPQSIAFDSMDESAFRSLWTGLCAHLITRYWPGMTEDEIAAMAELMPEGV